jgi:hypothetical protein
MSYFQSKNGHTILIAPEKKLSPKKQTKKPKKQRSKFFWKLTPKANSKLPQDNAHTNIISFSFSMQFQFQEIMEQQKQKNQAIWIFPIILCKTKKQRTGKSD